MRSRFAAAVLVGLFVTAMPVGAQTPADVAAVAYRDLPAGLALRVQLLDDSDLNLRVRELVAEELAAGGYPVAEGAPFVLLVETQTNSETDSGPSLGSFEVDDEGARIRMNLWSSREDSLLRGRQESGTIEADARYRISLGLYDGRDGRYYWRGTVTSTLDQGDAADASRAMVPALLAHFGKTVRAAPVTE